MSLTKHQLLTLLQENNVCIDDLKNAKKPALLERARAANLISPKKDDKPKPQCQADQTCVPLRNKERVIVDWAIIDIKDADMINKHKWHLTNGYASNGERESMHAMVSGKAPDGQVIDHIDRNKLNNTRKNLRFVSRNINSQNVEKQKGVSSNFYGVSWYKRDGKWWARYANIHIGYFDIETHAAFAYDEYIREMFGKDGRVNGLNKPPGFVPYTKQQKPTNKRGVTKNGSRYRVLYKDPRIHKIIHLGYYDTEDEASKVYEEYRESVEQEIHNEHMRKPITRNADGIAYITARSKDESVNVLVDDDKWYEFIKYKWHITKHGYAKANIGHMHKLVLEGKLIDHRNGKLDNRRCSLVVNDHSGNNHNKSTKSESGYTGLSRRGKKFQVKIKKNKERFYLGSYHDVKVAAYAYNCAARQLYRDLAKLNDVETPENYAWDPEKWRLIEVKVV